MIKINLLPLEKRRPERTPLGRFLLIVSGVAAVCVIAVVIFWLQFIKIADAKKVVEDIEQKLNSPQAAKDRAEFDALTAKKAAAEGRKQTVEKLKAPFRWTEILDIICDKLETTHTKVWIDEIKMFELNDMRTKAQTLGFTPETGMVLEGSSAGPDPEPLLRVRQDVVRPSAAPPAGNTATGPRRKEKVLIDYFNGKINKMIAFTLKDQPEAEQKYSNVFSIEFYVKGAAAK